MFQSEDSGNIRTIDGYEDNGNKYAYDVGRKYKFTDFEKVPGSVNKAEKEYPNRSWFDYEGDSFALRKTGGSLAFTRPLNGGDPFKDTPGGCWQDCRSVKSDRQRGLKPGLWRVGPKLQERAGQKRHSAFRTTAPTATC